MESSFTRIKKWSKHSPRILSKISQGCLLCPSLSVGPQNNQKRPNKKLKMFKSQLRLYLKKRRVLTDTPKEFNKHSKIKNYKFSQKFKNLASLIKRVMSIRIRERREFLRHLLINQKFLLLERWMWKLIRLKWARMRLLAIIRTQEIVEKRWRMTFRKYRRVSISHVPRMA